MTEKTALSFGLIGCGRIAQTYLEVLSSLPDCQLKAVADIRVNAVTSVAEQFDCESYTDYRKLAKENHLNAVLVCTPPDSHCEIATFFLEKGVHVLCEKPLAMNSHEAVIMTQKSKDTGQVLMMGSKFRYVDDLVKAKGVVESGILGEILLFENVFCGKVDMRRRWNSRREQSGGGVLIDNGSHSIDIARYLLGPITKVQAEEGKRIQSAEVEDTCRLYFRTSSEVMGAVDLSWSLSKEKDSYIDIYGSDGTLSIGWKSSQYRQIDKAPWVQFGNGYSKMSAFTNQVRNFIGAIQGSEPPLINLEDGLSSVRVIQAAYASMTENKWVDVDTQGPELDDRTETRSRKRAEG